MTREEFKAIRHQLGLTINEAADLLNLSNSRTIRRYEDGEVPVTGPAAVVMRMLAELPGALDFARFLADERRAQDAD